MKVTSLVLVCVCVALRAVTSQLPALIPIDDPRMPMFEQLIWHGDIVDPSPMVRPVNRREALTALHSARCASRSVCEAVVAQLIRAWQPEARRNVLVAVYAGIATQSSDRRAPLWPAGTARTNAYARADVAAGSEDLFAQLHGEYDPSWSTNPDRGSAAGQNFPPVQGAAGIDNRWGALVVERIATNWGPDDTEGLPRSSSSIPEPAIAFRVGSGRVRFTARLGRLDDTLANDGAPDRRWLAMHRLDLRISDRLSLAGWETAVAQGERRSGDDAWYGVFGLLAFDQVFGRQQQRNSMIGIDADWHPGSMRWQAQLALDDWTSRAPMRYGFTLSTSAPVSARASWRLIWSRVSNLAYRTTDPREDYLYHQVSLGPIFPDHDLLRLVGAFIATPQVLFRPEISYLIQGSGRIQTPFPGYDSLPRATGLLEPPVRRTIRIGTRIDGCHRWGFISLDAGMNIDRGPAVESRTHFEGRASVTVGGTAASSWQ